MSGTSRTPRVAIVLSGAAGRGAFQAGALARLMPALHRSGLRPSILLGTSAGAINAALWGSLSHLDAESAGEALTSTWQRMDRQDILGHPLLTLAADGVRMLPGLLTGRGRGVPSLLDTRALERTARQTLDTRRLARNIDSGCVDAVGVVATRVPPPRHPIASGRTTVFIHSTIPTSGIADEERAVDVAGGFVSTEQVLASAAIPAAFPAVFVPAPEPARGWYVDGGVRLNAPLRPAVALGADRIVVVSANSTTYPPAPAPSAGDEPRPTVALGAAMTLHTVLADRMVEDLRELRAKNVAAKAGTGPYRHIQLLEVSPPPRTLARLAAETVAGKHRRLWHRALADSDSIALDRMLRGLGGSDELLSYLLFDDEYFAAQLSLGADAADAALAAGWVD